jgi:hypothetical protein
LSQADLTRYILGTLPISKQHEHWAIGWWLASTAMHGSHAKKVDRLCLPVSVEPLLKTLRMVDRVIEFNDEDDTAIDAIRVARTYYTMPRAKFIFANGGDRTADNIPEMVFDDVDFALV